MESKTLQTKETSCCNESATRHRSLGKPRYELADVFRLYLADYLKTHKLSSFQKKVVHAIMSCRTSAMGGHLYRCNNCGQEWPEYDSCRNRHCPKCQHSAKLRWVKKRLKELLPIPYYHYVMTMPHTLNTLALYNKGVIYRIFFEAAAYSINTFAGDKKYLGAKLGFIGILHTWGQLLDLHVHLHFLVTGGGISEDGKRWLNLPYRGRFLFPVKAVSKVMRQRFSYLLKKAYDNGELSFPDKLHHLKDSSEFERYLNKVAWDNWYNYSKRPFSGPEDVVSYIGRYTHRVAISNYRLLGIDGGKIRFRYKRYRDHRVIWQETEMDAMEFIRRFLLHVVPPGFKRIRHYGFLAAGCRKAMLAQARACLQVVREHVQERMMSVLDLFIDREDVRRCPYCEVGTLIYEGLLAASQRAP